MRTLLIALCASAALPAMASAADQMIRPQCWEENVNGEVHRHCQVDRPETQAHPASPPPAAAPAPRPLYNDGTSYGPPPQAYYRPPNYRWYAGPQSIQPNFGPGYRGPPSPGPYGVPYPPAFYPPPYYYPQPYYYGPPGFVFGFGPFVFGIGP